MTIQVGDTLPSVNLTMMTAEGPKPISLKELSAGKKVVLLQSQVLLLPPVAHSISQDLLKEAKK